MFEIMEVLFKQIEDGAGYLPCTGYHGIQWCSPIRVNYTAIPTRYMVMIDMMCTNF